MSLENARAAYPILVQIARDLGSAVRERRNVTWVSYDDFCARCKELGIKETPRTVMTKLLKPVQAACVEHNLPDLAFDHNRIVDYALQRLRTKVEYADIAHSFLGETFTIAQLRTVHEAVLGHKLDAANFRRSVATSPDLVDTGEVLTGTPHRPPKLYRFTRNPSPTR